MKLNWISILALLLTISSIQWGVSTGEELNGKASNNRLRRQSDNTDSSYIDLGGYILVLLIGLCVCIAFCVIFCIIACIVLCITCAVKSSSRNKPTHVTTTQTIPCPNPQPYNYSYHQPVQSHGYYPPVTLQAQDDSRPPSYQTAQRGNPMPQPNIGFQI